MAHQLIDQSIHRHTHKALLLAVVLTLGACATTQSVEENPPPAPVVETKPEVSEPMVLEPAKVEEPRVLDPLPPEANFHFAFDSSSVQTQEARNIEQWAEFINKFSIRQVELHGHADSTGPDNYNQTLSAKRSASIADALRAKINQPVTISEIAHGESQPVADNITESGRQLNRRVEISVRMNREVATSTVE
ncbi:MAG: OmpA family protein [Pseudomonadales bacterium]|nr:OmpA family protein [Pseudomonadales bacterium]